MKDNEQKEENAKEDINIDESEIYKQMDFKKEFDDLLNKLNNVKDEELDNITNIDLDFLKNDYIELYDLRKLLNGPKYHIAKFKILFLDFINLKDYFYKTFGCNELINIEKNTSKSTNNMNTNKINDENNRNNKTEKEIVSQKTNKKPNENKNEIQNKQINISEKKLININNIHSIDGIQEKQLNAKEEIIN